MGKTTRYLIVNTDPEREIKTTIELPGCSAAVAVYDLFGGGLYKLAAEAGRFDVELAPAGSIVVVCGEEADQARADAPAILGCGASFASLSSPHQW